MAQRLFQYVVNENGTTVMHTEAESELNQLLESGYRLTNVTTVPFAKGEDTSKSLLVINILEKNENGINQVNANASNINAGANPQANGLDWLKNVDPNVLKALLGAAGSPAN